MEMDSSISILNFYCIENNFMEKLIARMDQYSRLKYLVILFAIAQIFQITIDTLIFYIYPSAHAEYLPYEIEFFFSNNLAYSLILFILIGPFIETIVFQIFLLVVLKRVTKWIFNTNSWVSSFILTSLIFSATHGLEYADFSYWLINAFIRVPGSLCLTLIAIIEYEKKCGNPTLYVFLFHALHNAIQAILILLFN